MAKGGFLQGKHDFRSVHIRGDKGWQVTSGVEVGALAEFLLGEVHGGLAMAPIAVASEFARAFSVQRGDAGCRHGNK